MKVAAGAMRTEYVLRTYWTTGNFVSIQQSHTIACDGYRQPYLRTGYENVIPHRVSDIFAVTAKKPGKVLKRDDRQIIVEYEDGSKEGVLLGRRYGKAEGSVYPHDILSPLKAGESFEIGDTIAYNSGFFEPDFMNPKALITKNNLVAKTVLYESSQTHEDASSISREISNQLMAKTTKIHSEVVSFKEGIRAVLKPGSQVNPMDTLFIIEDEVTNDAGLFNETTIESLKRIAGNAPQAAVSGTIDRYEVFYLGNKEDMSPSLRSLANISDKAMAEVKEITGYSSGKVDQEYRVDGDPLLLDTAEIKVYIITQAPSGTGDKAVFANQMKSTHGEVMNYDMHTENGEKIDAVFGFRSISNRIVNSPIIIGTTISLLKTIGKQMTDIYRGK